MVEVWVWRMTSNPLQRGQLLLVCDIRFVMSTITFTCEIARDYEQYLSNSTNGVNSLLSYDHIEVTYMVINKLCGTSPNNNTQDDP